MKKWIALLAVATLSLANTSSNGSLPDIKIKDLNGNLISASTLSNNGKPMVISFWATWCKPCVRELNTINDLIVDWEEETGVKVVAVSIDDSRQSARVRPFVTSQGWEYEVYLDENGELKRAMNVNNIPHTFLVNGKGEIVWEHNGYFPGDEDHLYELIQKVAKGEAIDHK
jgi:peroxiredoxin